MFSLALTHALSVDCPFILRDTADAMNLRDQFVYKTHFLNAGGRNTDSEKTYSRPVEAFLKRRVLRCLITQPN